MSPDFAHRDASQMMTPFPEFGQLPCLGLLVLASFATVLQAFKAILAVAATVIASYEVTSDPEAVRRVQALAACHVAKSSVSSANAN